MYAKRQESQGAKKQDSNNLNRPNQIGSSQPKKASMVVAEQDALVESSNANTDGHSETLDVDQPPNAIDLLYSSESDDGGVLTVRLSDHGSKAQSVRLLVQDVSWHY